MNSNLIIKTLAAAVAVGCAGSASAISLLNYADVGTTATIRAAGSTAHDPGLLNLLRVTTTGFQLCAPGTLDHYQMNANLNIYFCSAGVNSGIAGANRRIAILRNGTYGSGSGVSTLIKGTTTQFDITGSTIFSDFPDILAGSTVSAAATATIAASGPLGAYVFHNAVATLTTTGVADIGITDEEPGLFDDVFAPNLGKTDIATKLTKKAISGVIFGVPVSRNIYARLQAMQFDVGSTCHPSNTTYGTLSANAADAANSEACMPSLSREQLAAIYKGDISDWSTVLSANTAGENVTTVTASADIGTLSDTTVYIERRVPTSGTQLASQIYFLGKGCSDSALPFIDALTAPLRVRENAGSGNVRTNLGVRNSAGQGAIGVLSTETATTPTTGWRFVKLNGFAPSLLNVVKGNYDFFYESSLQYRSSAVGGVAALAGIKKTVADRIASTLGLPASVTLLDSGFNQTYGGRTGLLANAVDQFAGAPVPPYTAAVVNAAPVATSTRGPGGVPDSCLSPARIGGFPVGN